MANTDLDKALEEGGVPPTPKEDAPRTPMYKVLEGSKIPVSKAMGKLWQSRRDQAVARRRRMNIEEAWDEAIRYYNNDQLSHRVSTGGESAGNESLVRSMRKRTFSETENIVFANVTAIVPALYAKNPQCEFTAAGDEDQPKRLALVTQRLVNTLSARKCAPGINLKPKARRAVVMATLTNKAWLEVGYTKKEESSEQAFEEIKALSDKLAAAEDTKEILHIEGEIKAIEHKIDLLRPSGPFVKYNRPHQVFVIQDADEDEYVDARAMMKYEFMDTEFIRAVYSKQDDESDTFSSIYQPTHVLRLNAGAEEQAIDDEVSNFTLLDSDENDYKKFGYDSEDSFRRAQRTKVWWVWDAVTRRVYLYNDRDWTWPIWVWDDPYGLDQFFPFYPIEFYTNPEGGDAKGEVTYYLDQQDAVNEINDEERRIRHWVRTKIFYNKNLISKADVEKYIKAQDDVAIGLNLPEDVKLSEAVFSAPPPSANFAQLFNVDRKLQAIDRISSVSDVLRGVQYKTNTTNKAIQSYEATTSLRIDEKIDAVEDCLSNLYWGIAQMCLQFMNAETVSYIIGEDVSDVWQQMEPREIYRTMSVRVIGGSTTKPTSRAKKEEAIEVGQILGQFASVSPAAIIVALKLLEQSFDEINIRAEDWQFIRSSIEQSMRRGDSTGGEGNAAGGEVQEDMPQGLEGLPPQVQQAVQLAIQRGVPPEQAIAEITQSMQ